MWLVTKDCCGLICAFFTVSLMIFAEFVQIKFVLAPWKGYTSWYVIVYTICFLLSLASHLRCMTKDPGAVPKDLECKENKEDESLGLVKCGHCEIPKPVSAHHCSSCERCVIRQDHHCPWVNNCVGFMNQKYFVLFLFWTAVTCLWCLVTLVSRFVSCASVKRSFRPTDPFCLPSPADTICCVLNFVEAIMFGLFVTIMMFDQLTVVYDNTTYIDKLQGRKRVRRSKMDSLRELFGELSPSITWLLPTFSTPKICKDFEKKCEEFRWRRNHDY